jgi:riboflavin synthase
MFTGIIESIGTIKAVSQTPAGVRLNVDLGKLAGEVKLGGSVAINGACQSAVAINGTVVEFDTIFETLSRTNLGRLQNGDKVNLELSLKVTDRIEGHFVQGHVDTTCRIVRWQDEGTSKRLTLEPDDRDCMKYIIPKGSVALDGISLTIAEVRGERFSVALIPTTLRDTTLLDKPVGAVLNLETDILVKTIVSQQERLTGGDDGLKNALRRSGFVG